MIQRSRTLSLRLLSTLGPRQRVVAGILVSMGRACLTLLLFSGGGLLALAMLSLPKTEPLALVASAAPLILALCIGASAACFLAVFLLQAAATLVADGPSGLRLFLLDARAECEREITPAAHEMESAAIRQPRRTSLPLTHAEGIFHAA